MRPTYVNRYSATSKYLESRTWFLSFASIFVSPGFWSSEPAVVSGTILDADFVTRSSAGFIFCLLDGNA